MVLAGRLDGRRRDSLGLRASGVGDAGQREGVRMAHVGPYSDHISKCPFDDTLAAIPTRRIDSQASNSARGGEG